MGDLQMLEDQLYLILKGLSRQILDAYFSRIRCTQKSFPLNTKQFFKKRLRECLNEYEFGMKTPGQPIRSYCGCCNQSCKKLHVGENSKSNQNRIVECDRIRGKRETKKVTKRAASPARRIKKISYGKSDDERSTSKCRRICRGSSIEGSHRRKKSKLKEKRLSSMGNTSESEKRDRSKGRNLGGTDKRCEHVNRKKKKTNKISKIRKRSRSLKSHKSEKEKIGCEVLWKSNRQRRKNPVHKTVQGILKAKDCDNFDYPDKKVKIHSKDNAEGKKKVVEVLIKINGNKKMKTTKCKSSESEKDQRSSGTNVEEYDSDEDEINWKYLSNGKREIALISELHEMEMETKIAKLQKASNKKRNP